MGTLVLGIIVAVILIGFGALYLWSQRTERDVVFWERKRRTPEEAQSTQFNAAINVLGSVDR
jgi:uncharacterized iron-regulated membrane protein